MYLGLEPGAAGADESTELWRHPLTFICPYICHLLYLLYLFSLPMVLSFHSVWLCHWVSIGSELSDLYFCACEQGSTSLSIQFNVPMSFISLYLQSFLCLSLSLRFSLSLLLKVKRFEFSIRI